MNIARFLEHWQLTENPFRAEEARHDGVLARMKTHIAAHPDFEKILGDVGRPSTSIVFGEKGSGKTAIRLHLADCVAAHNREHQGDRVLFVPYDDLNPFLDALHEHHVSHGRSGKGGGGGSAGGEDREILKSLEKTELVDHMDAILTLAVDQVVTAVVSHNASTDTDPPSAIDHDAVETLRNAERSVRDDLLLLQALYGRPESSGTRLADLRRTVRGPMNWKRVRWALASYFGWILPVGVIILYVVLEKGLLTETGWLIFFLVMLLVWGAIALKHFFIDNYLLKRLGRRLASSIRVSERSPESFAECLDMLPAEARARTSMPLTRSDEPRYLLLEKLVRVLRAARVHGVMVVMDRVDEPTLINGDANRMRAVIWPMLNNKFLQQGAIGFKLLLPLELRYELLRESSAFFQEARLDKQSLIERLTWTGTMLYDLCAERLNACRSGDAESISLLDLFGEDVTRQDLIDALDQMHQPRDAFKLIYHCVHEHCAAVPEDESACKIPRHVLDHVRKEQSDRVQAFYRGLRPA